ncbi:Fe-S protein assembly co-chaperone HscB [Ectothiorhodospira lacustris]|uniref:Fe-S protein assembly co-chaperone HscB n=1 Tax=Ectothiorhodospira lacustris TaxID=2899127 RepID=UPI001EE95540|nr:Fe-S protein assembly co-chaperone HscB [Ectothiorhodospira lacustris]MCG5499798.1 Fe-S protein assembly co-chaperone HscB [Ectothiorhodospira lacustris]MCG5510517.1 Fe-S protein assembly co-chaperone HscB [Ectothiorhodospira lacustris]MCG5522263.1 Fe-S protein assembly co-chaperone HscB [Ectothiorhodospira lacustris]
MSEQEAPIGPALDFGRDYFALLGQPREFRIDLEALSRAYRALQADLHPDRFAQASEQQRRLAVQGSSHVNEAYATLRDDTRRARYLLSLRGVEVDDDRATASDTAFLMDQMELRETLEAVPEAADPFAALDRVTADIEARHHALIEAFEAAWAAGDLAQAREQVLKLRFFNRLRDELERIRERLEDDLP